jgi:SNF2 family DNA or RNA helicase
MGVGKSVQSLACSLMFLESFPILIICPSALKYVWKDEVGKWLKGVIKAEEVVIIKKSSLT